MLTITEANAVNILLDHILGQPNADETLDQRVDRLAEATVLLAEKANKALGAGWRPDDVRAKWEAS